MSKRGASGLGPRRKDWTIRRAATPARDGPPASREIAGPRPGDGGAVPYAYRETGTRDSQAAARRRAGRGEVRAARAAVSADMLPNMPHSRMPPTPPLRPSHPWPGVAKGLGPRVKGRVLPNSPKSAPLTGGRFRRPAKTHEGTPSGAHFSRRCRVWRPAGGPRECRDAGRVYGSPPA